MLEMAAARLGYRTVVLDPDADAPAAQLANQHIVATYDDRNGLELLARLSDVVTYEFENVPENAVAVLDPLVTVRPGGNALAVAQDRLREKSFLVEAGIPTADHRPVDDQASLEQAVDELGGQAIVKTRRLGYDGKGQLRIVGGQAPVQGFEQLGSVPCIAEALVDFECEISVIVARSVDDDVVCFDPARNDHREGILATSTVPAAIDPEVEAAAVAAATTLIRRLDYIGVLGLELFVLPEGTIVANEFAPRVHNSGHWTEAACAVSQFEQHLRAVTGLPLAQPGRHSDCVMENLIGDDVERLPKLLLRPDTMVHLYGKREVRTGRKMGHVTTLVPRG